jgi:hypothetical protein
MDEHLSQRMIPLLPGLPGLPGGLMLTLLATDVFKLLVLWLAADFTNFSREKTSIFVGNLCKFMQIYANYIGNWFLVALLDQRVEAAAAACDGCLPARLHGLGDVGTSRRPLSARGAT